LLLCVVAAGLGLGVAAAVSPTIYREIGAGGLALPWSVIATGLALGALVGLVSALPPSLRVHRLNIVDALAGR
jgi:putative ABC transport system permease protein